MLNYQVMAFEAFPEVKKGDNISALLEDVFRRENFHLENEDIIVVAHKIVSKAEGRMVSIEAVMPSKEAQRLGKITAKDSRLIQLIIEESSEVLYYEKSGFVLARHRLGFICANAAVDASNAGPNKLICLPEHPDRSAERIRKNLEVSYGKAVGVIICDTQGRPFYEGASGTAIGASGVQMLKSYKGKADRNGYMMKSTVEDVGTELAGAATLLMGQADEGRPVVVIRGLKLQGNGSASGNLRNPSKDVAFKALKLTAPARLSSPRIEELRRPHL